MNSLPYWILGDKMLLEFRTNIYDCALKLSFGFIVTNFIVLDMKAELTQPVNIRIKLNIFKIMLS